MDDSLVDWFELIVAEHQRGRLDVLHAYFLAQAGFIAAYAGKYLRVPSVVSARGNDLERAVFDPSRAAHILYALQHASAVTANANELAKKARALVPSLAVTVIPNGIDTEHFQPFSRNNALAESLSLMNGSKLEERTRVIGFTRELREKKGLRVLLNAVVQANKKHPCTLLIVGDVRAGDDRQFFEEFRHLYSDAQIAVTGFVSHRDLPAYFSLMDVFVHPSLRDGMPNALLEAIACGIADAVIDCENGRFVLTNNVSELVHVMDELLSNEDV